MQRNNQQMMVVSQSQIAEAQAKQATLTNESAQVAFAQFLHLEMVNPKTISQYHSQIKIFFEWCKDHHFPAWQATYLDIKAYRLFLAEKKLAKSTVNSRLVTVRRFFQALQDAGYRLDNPASGIRPLRDDSIPVSRIKWLSEAQIQAMLDLAGKAYPTTKMRNQAAIILMAFCGLRGQEVCNVQRKDIDVEQRSLLVHGKRAKDRLIGLTPKQFEYIQALLDTIPEHPETFLFTNASNKKGQHPNLQVRGLRTMIDSLLIRLKIKQPKTSSHSLRRACAHALYRKGVDMYGIAEQLGHADINTTKRYIDSLDLVQNPVTSVLDNLLDKKPEE